MKLRFLLSLSIIVLLSGFKDLPNAGAEEDPLDFFLAGEDMLGQKKYAEAVVQYEKAVEADPKSGLFLYKLGLAYEKVNRMREALIIYKRIVNISDAYPTAISFAKTKIKMLSQIPMKKVEKKRVLTPLERRALAEEKNFLNYLKSGDNSLKYKIKRIVIDPGHGGFDSGAVGKELKEKDLALDIARRLKKVVDNSSNIVTFLTRTGDYYLPLSARTVIANQYRADLFLSLHVNASSRYSARGMETYFCSEKASNEQAARVAAFENSVAKDEAFFRQVPGFVDIDAILLHFERRLYWKDSGEFAGIFQKGLANNINLEDRGVNSANFFVLRNAKMPAILIEAGFISNQEEEKLLNRYAFREKIASSIAMSIVRYEKNLNHPDNE
jgi:N-acetylmuramoyl-L-alanine amidase